MSLTKKQITTLLLLLGLIVGIFLTIYLVKQRQEIRPRALQGKANLLLSAGNASPKVGDSFDVLVSLQLTDASLQVSGADVMILYDKTRLQVTNLLPQVPGVDPDAAFTDAPIVTYGGVFDESFNFARVSLVARKTTATLAKGTVSLARVTFKSLNTGTATVKFPDDDSLLQIVGYGLGIPTVSSTPTITPGGPTLTPPPAASNTPEPPTETPPEIPTDIPPPTEPPSPTNPPASCSDDCHFVLISDNHSCTPGTSIGCPGGWCANCGSGNGCYTIPAGYNDCGCDSGSQRKYCKN